MIRSITLFVFVALAALQCAAQSASKPNIDDYRDAIFNAASDALQGDAAAALTKFSKALPVNKKYFSTWDYYEGAGYAVQAKKLPQAMLYLQQCVTMGWADSTKLAEDPLFVPLHKDKGWPALMTACHRQYVALMALMQPLKNEPLLMLVPYKAGNKWGWMDKTNKKVVTAAVFDFADFSFREDDADFDYKGSRYFYTPILDKLSSMNEGLNESIETMKQMEEEGFPRPYLKGFNTAGDYSDKYESVHLISQLDRSQPLGVAFTKGKGGKYGIIDTAGNVQPGFELVYDEIRVLNDGKASMVVVCKKGELYEVKNSKGENLVEGPFSASTQLDYYEHPHHPGMMSDEKETRYAALKKGNSWNVLDPATGKFLFNKWYDEIIDVNGVANLGGKGTLNVFGKYPDDFFLVTEKGKTFYVDARGQEYIINNP